MCCVFFFCLIGCLTHRQGCTCLFVSSSLLHTSAEWLGSWVARRAGQTVVAWICILAAVHAVELKAGIWYLLALFIGLKTVLIVKLDTLSNKVCSWHNNSTEILPRQHLCTWCHCQCSQLDTFHISRNHQGNWCTWLQRSRGWTSTHLRTKTLPFY